MQPLCFVMSVLLIAADTGVETAVLDGSAVLFKTFTEIQAIGCAERNHVCIVGNECSSGFRMNIRQRNGFI